MRLTSSLVLFPAVLFPTALLAQTTYSTPMRDVENPDRSPYQETASFTLDPPFVNGFGNFSTPIGKRYIIEYVSITCSSPDNFDSFPQVYLGVRKIISSSVTSGTSVPLMSLVRTGGAAFGGSAFFGGMKLKAYSDWDPFAAGGTGGQAISLNVFHTDASVQAACLATITGHTLSNP
jgi:hypothetical protein